jgi:alpha-tubulin suppressor-like RCC1 family protein
VSGLGNGISKVSGGGGHTCALTTGGRIKYWGNNTNGELGDGTPMEKHVPTDVLGFTGSGAIAITASQYRTCAVTTGGVVKCWGWNNRGQVGNGTVNTLGGVTTPVDVWGLSGVTQVSSGNDHTCAVTGARQVACWGLNYYGQLGNGQSSYQLTPGDVSGLASGISAISSGATHTCVLTTGGAVKCWGDNNNGQLGDGTGLQRYTIIAVAGLSSGVAQISGSGDHTCALTSLGGVKCWGLSGLADVSGLTSGVKAISVSQDHSCAVTTAGTIKCWGDNSWGQLGDGTKNPSQAAPLAVSGNSSGASAVSVAFGHTCALVSGCVKCWGLNQYGELGDGTNNDSSTPVNVSGLASGVSAVITGAQSPGGRAFSCALVTGGAIKCWGTSLVTLSSPTPLSMNGFTTGVSKISAGDNHFCAVTTDGRVKCMGSNQFGPLGDGQGYDGTAYTYGLAAGSILDVSAGREHTCALTSAGGVKCWGDNSYGQLGYGEARYIAVPRLVLGFGQSTYLYLPLVKR